MTLRSMEVIPEHDCDHDGEVDSDICLGCKDHSTFCSQCGLSACCGVRPVNLD